MNKAGVRPWRFVVVTFREIQLPNPCYPHPASYERCRKFRMMKLVRGQAGGILMGKLRGKNCRVPLQVQAGDP